jgi:hypothetical protein
VDKEDIPVEGLETGQKETEEDKMKGEWRKYILWQKKMEILGVK